jgi:mannose-1-phosphate guanylyltransferase
VREVLVNTHHLPDAVREFTEGPGRSYGVPVRLMHEETLLGTAGTIRAARDFVEGEDSFFILYADNVSDVDLGRMAAWHDTHGGTMTIGLFQAPHPERCGIAVMEEDGRVTAFEEKPARPRSSWANAGIYVARPALLEHLDVIAQERSGVHGVLDFGYDVLPRLARQGELRGYPVREYLLDIGTPDGYAAALGPTAEGRD